MLKNKQTKKVIKITTSLIALLIFIALLIILWQRQPKPQIEQKANTSSTQSANLTTEETAIKTSPKSGTIINSSTTTLGIQTDPNSIVVIYSDTFEKVLNSNNEGNLETKIELSDGLNLINITVYSQDFAKQITNTLTFYAIENSGSDTVFAGPVKTIFDNLITVTDGEKDINARTLSSTVFSLPKADEEEAEATQSVKNIRIGDYAIILGKSTDEDSMEADYVEIMREDKPIISKNLEAITILTTVRENIFSARNAKGEVLEFTLGRNLQVILDGEEVETAEIVKDKNAIVFFSQTVNQKTASTIYLLP